VVHAQVGGGSPPAAEAWAFGYPTERDPWSIPTKGETADESNTANWRFSPRRCGTLSHQSLSIRTDYSAMVRRCRGNQSRIPTHLGEKVYSLYRRGSVAKGTAIAGVSDIDTFAVVFGEGRVVDRSWSAAFQQRMAVQYPFQMFEAGDAGVRGRELTAFPWLGADDTCPHQTRIAAQSPLRRRLQSDHRDVLCGLETHRCPPTVRFREVAERLPFARSCPVWGRGSHV
jgi:hypothetical protein